MASAEPSEPIEHHGCTSRQVHVLLGVVGVDRADRAALVDQEVEEHVERVRGRGLSRPIFAAMTRSMVWPSNR